MHPVTRILDWLPDCDFAVLRHHFLPHGRDYAIMIQDWVGADPGEHELIFTHCVQIDYETRVQDTVLATSWDDVFCDFAACSKADGPSGYVWGVNWSNAEYRGLNSVNDSSIAAQWTARIGKPFFEATLETNQFWLRLIFHSLRHRKLSSNTSKGVKGDRSKFLHPAAQAEDSTMTTAQIIELDGTQAVRLPEEFRFASSTVSIRKDGQAVVLEPLKAATWPEDFFDQIHTTDPAFDRPLQGQMPPAPTFP